MVVKRVLNMFIVWCMLASLVSFGWVPNQLVPQVLQTDAAQAAQTVNIGDYIQFGKYNSAPILWRVINVDPTTGDPILLADRILTIKAFDAKGSYHPSVNSRNVAGSNYYPDSNIRQWLNSSSPNSGGNMIDWIQNDPTAGNMSQGDNPYNTEKGFLADGNLSATERSLIKPYTHKVLLTGVDNAEKDGGSANHSVTFDIADITNYDSAYYKNVTDSIFMLSVKQVKEWVYDNSATLGTNYYMAKPTPEAVTQSTYKNSSLKSNVNFSYLLNTPQAQYSYLVRAVGWDGGIGWFNASEEYVAGVRPALQLDLSSDIFKSGSGTSSKPYSLNEFPTLSGIEVSADNKTIYVYSDTDLNATTTDTSKITLTANKAVVAASKITATVEGNRTLKIVSTTALSGTTNKLALAAGVVKSDADKNNTALAETALTITPKFPTKLKSTTVSSDNKSVSLELDVTGLSNPSIAESSRYDSLKSAVNIATDGKTYVALGENDDVAYDNSTKKLTVTFENALTSTKAMIQVSAGALALTPPTANNKVLSPAFKSTVIDVYPQAISTTLSADNKTLTIKYNKPIKNAVDTDVKSTTNLKAAISFGSDIEFFYEYDYDFGGRSLDSTETVSIKGDSIVIVFTTPLSGSFNRVVIAEGAVKDAKSKLAAKYPTSVITPDETGPTVVGVGYAAGKIILYFNENIALNGTTSLKTLAESMKYGADVSFTKPTAVIKANTLTITHTTTAITSDASVTKVKIPADLLKDAAGNKNVAIETMPADGTAPKVVSYSNYGSTGLTISFSEQLYPLAKTIPLSAISITTGSGNSAITKPLSDATWKTPTTTVTVSGVFMYISNLKTALAEEIKISIKKDTVTDFVLNKNAAIQFALYATPYDAKVMLDVADSGLSSITNSLQRIRELAVVAQDNSLSAGDRTAMQSEVNALIAQITTVANNSSFDSTNLIGSPPYTLRTMGTSPSNTPRTFTFIAATASALGVSTIDISTTGAAAAAVTPIDAAISDVSTARTNIGTESSFMDSVIASLM